MELARALSLGCLVALAACRGAEPADVRPAHEAPTASPPGTAIVEVSGSVAAAPASAAAEGASAAAAPASAPPPLATPPEPPSIDALEVPGDSPAFIVRGERPASTHTLFMPGLCSNAYGYLFSFPEAARAHGGVVAIDGDKPCGAADSGFHTFSWNPELQRKRLDAALGVAGVPDPPGGYTLVGYSSGASIAELMHTRWPQRFPRLVLIAPPKDPAIPQLRTARAVVSMACSLDVTWRMKRAAKRLDAVHVPALYLEMPGCTHGNIAEGDRIFGEAFDFLEQSDRALLQ